MNASPTIAALAKALAAAQGVMRPAVKDALNPHFRSRYADLASIWEACRAPLSAHGLSVTQLLTANANGAGVTVQTVLMHESGEYIASELPLGLKDSTPQAVGSAVTYARRYALAAIVGVSADDDDGAAASTTKENHAPPPPRPEAPRPEARAETQPPPAPASPATPAKLTDTQRWNIAVAQIHKKLGQVSGAKLIDEISQKHMPAGATKVPDDKRPALIAELEAAAKGDVK